MPTFNRTRMTYPFHHSNLYPHSKDVLKVRYNVMTIHFIIMQSYTSIVLNLEFPIRQSDETNGGKIDEGFTKGS